MTVFSAIDKQRLDTLAGTLGNQNSAGGQAVTRSNLSPLALLVPTQVSAASGSVSVAQYNVLVAEYLALRQAITEIVAAIT